MKRNKFIFNHWQRKIASCFLTFLFLIVVIQSYSQSESDSEFESLLENFFNGDETRDMEQLLQDMQALQTRQISINNASAEDLSVLPFLNPLQVNAILDYRKEHGNILSVGELSIIPGLGEQQARLLSYFISFGDTRAGYRAQRDKHEILTRWGRLIERQKAYREPRKYEGSPDRLYFRYKYDSSSMQIGVTGEKDAGESFFSQSNKEGFDFYSGYINYKQEKWSVVLGDYNVRFGQGLVVWQGFSLGKSAETTTIGNSAQGVRPYTSADENGYFRGISAHISAGRFSFMPFFSYSKIDAGTEEIGGQKIFTSIRTAGYHRTAGEIEGKNSVGALSTGGHLQFDGDYFSVGLTGLHTKYQYPFVRDDTPYNEFLFQGKDVTNFSLDYRWGVNKLYFFGETAMKTGGGWAQQTGFMYHPFDKADVAVLYRNIGKRYGSPFASTLMEGSQVNDEEGLYVGLKILPISKVTVNAYVDFFKFRHAKYTTVGPGNGHEYLVNIGYKPDKDWQLDVRYARNQKPVRLSGTYSVKDIKQVRQSLRFNLNGNLSKTIALKTRIEQSWFNHDHKSTGFFVGQDLGFHPPGWAWSNWLRIAYFNTADYDSRIYAYENDVLYQFSTPAHYGEGIRSYFTGKVKICENLNFYYKLSRTWYFDVESIGSGDSEILGNKRTDVKILLRFTF